MGIAVDELAGRNQGFRLAERCQHGTVRIPVLAGRRQYRAAGEQWHVIEKDAVATDQVGNGQTVALAQFPVVGAVAGGDVDEPRSGLDVDEMRRQQRHIEIVAAAGQGMAAERAGKRAARQRAEARPGADACLRLQPRRQRFGDDQAGAGHGRSARTGVGHLEHAIGDVVAVGNRPVAGDRPGCRRPDHNRGVSEQRARRRDDRKSDKNGGRGVVVILDFCFRQRGPLDHRPQDWLGAAEERAAHQEAAEFAHDRSLGRERHRRIGLRPVTLDP